MSKIKLGEYFKMSNIRNFIEGSWNKFKSHSKFLTLDEHIKEQAVYRAILCKDCYNNGHCLHCGCATPDMFFAPNKVDHQKKWDKMLGKDEWEKFKEENEITNLDFDFTKIKENDLEDIPKWLQKKMDKENDKKVEKE